MNLTTSHPFWSFNNGLPATYPLLLANKLKAAGAFATRDLKKGFAATAHPESALSH